METINWYNDFVINEVINEELGEIFGTYSRLKQGFPNHPDFIKWNEDVNNWIAFERKLPDLFIPTKEEAESLMKDICAKSKQLRELEQNLSK